MTDYPCGKFGDFSFSRFGSNKKNAIIALSQVGAYPPQLRGVISRFL